MPQASSDGIMKRASLALLALVALSAVACAYAYDTDSYEKDRYGGYDDSERSLITCTAHVTMHSVTVHQQSYVRAMVVEIACMVYCIMI